MNKMAEHDYFLQLWVECARMPEVQLPHINGILRCGPLSLDEPLSNQGKSIPKNLYQSSPNNSNLPTAIPSGAILLKETLRTARSLPMI